MGGDRSPVTEPVVAEALPRPARLRLIRSLHRRGLTDVELAEALTYSTYTAARVRQSLGLLPNRPRRREHP